MGFAEEANDLAAEDLLPLKLTDLGRKLAHGFDQRLPGEFVDFGLSDDSLDRDTIRSWCRQFLILPDLGLTKRLWRLLPILTGLRQRGGASSCAPATALRPSWKPCA
jgi:hypothetical protein